jgi:hypothetical protein
VTSPVAESFEARLIQNEPSAKEPLPQSLHMKELLSFVEGIVAGKAKDDLWDEKTQRQVRSIADLLVKVLL